MKKESKKRKWSPEEIEKAREEHHEKIKIEGAAMSSKEWNAYMNYYDDKANKDETFEDYRKRMNQ